MFLLVLEFGGGGDNVPFAGGSVGGAIVPRPGGGVHANLSRAGGGVLVRISWLTMSIRPTPIQVWAKMWSPGLVSFFPAAVAYTTSAQHLATW